jgi:nucleotide-binding universal stress UspA family protein
MEAKIRNILFPVDFSNRSVLAVQHVRIWLDRLGATLNTLHIVDANALGHDAEPNGGFLDSDILNLISKRTADLKYFSDHYFGENVARHTVLSGGTADQIEYFAKRENIDLIMLPRDHQNLMSRILEDSLAAKLLEQCTASVWVTEHIDDLSPSAVPSILCAVHFEHDVTLDAQNHRILKTVRELATTFQTRVAFLIVIGGTVEESSEPVTHLQAVAGMEPFVAQVHGLFGSSAEILRKSGKVINAITDTAKQMSADLIVIGRSRPGTISLGRQTHVLKIDHAARRPVLSVW